MTGAILHARAGNWSGDGRDRRNLLVVLVVALLLRLVLLLATSPILSNDSASYLDLAHRLSSGHLHGYTGTRTPGYPVLLLLLGCSPSATAWVQSLVGVLSTLIAYALVRRLGGSPRAGLIAALAYTVNLEVLTLEHIVLTETVASFLVLLAGLLATGVLGKDRSSPPAGPPLRGAVLLGVTLAVLCLVRPDSLAVTVFLAGGIVAIVCARMRRRSQPYRRAGAQLAACLLLPALIALGGWALVNRANIGVTTVSTVLGYNMIDHMAAYVRVEPGRDRGIEAAYVAARTRREQTTANLANLSGGADPAMQRAAHLDHAHLSGRLLGIALSTIASHPLQYLVSSIKQLPRFFVPPNYADHLLGSSESVALKALWRLERALQILLGVTFLGVCALAAWRLVRRGASVLSAAGLLLAAVVLVGSLPAIFLAFGETGRYGYTYFATLLAVTAAAVPAAVSSLVHRSAAHREAPAPAA